MILFDIRHDDSHAGYINVVNRFLDTEPTAGWYLAQFGHVGSPQWWSYADRGEISVEVLTGLVSIVGDRPEPWSDEPEDIIEFVVGGQAIAYDRVDYWAAHPIRVGDRITLNRTKVEAHTPTGPITWLVDLRAEWDAVTPSGTSPVAP